MGLIEKAGEAFEKAGKNHDPSRSVTGAARDGGLFDIDFSALARQGFYTPQPRSARLARELRAVRRNLLRRLDLAGGAADPRQARRGGRRRNLVLMTSTKAGEGKTFCAVNLALSLACEDGMEVLLVDADAPRPSLRALFGLPEGPGLSDLLTDPAPGAEAYSFRARQAPLSVLPEGAPAGRLSDLIVSGEAGRLFAALSLARPKGVVIIDAPPVLASADATALARLADEVVFIVEAGATGEAGAGAALDEILEANSNVSLVLNRCLIGAGDVSYEAYGDYDSRRDRVPEERATGRNEQ